MRVHDAAFLQSARRLYMTATPRIFDGSVKEKAKAKEAMLTSMDDEALYGPEFFRLGFGEAVEMGLLTDYKVVVLTVSEKHVATSLQQNWQPTMARAEGGRSRQDHRLLERAGQARARRRRLRDFASDPAPMRRAVAFLRSINASKAFTKRFEEVVGQTRRPRRHRVALRGRPRGRHR